MRWLFVVAIPVVMGCAGPSQGHHGPALAADEIKLEEGLTRTVGDFELSVMIIAPARTDWQVKLGLVDHRTGVETTTKLRRGAEFALGRNYYVLKRLVPGAGSERAYGVIAPLSKSETPTPE